MPTEPKHHSDNDSLPLSSTSSTLIITKALGQSLHDATWQSLTHVSRAGVRISSLGCSFCARSLRAVCALRQLPQDSLVSRFLKSRILSKNRSPQVFEGNKQMTWAMPSKNKKCHITTCINIGLFIQPAQSVLKLNTFTPARLLLLFSEAWLVATLPRPLPLCMITTAARLPWDLPYLMQCKVAHASTEAQLSSNQWLIVFFHKRD